MFVSVDNLWGQSGVFQRRSSADTAHWEVEELWGWCWLGMETRVKTTRHWHRLDNTNDMKSRVHWNWFILYSSLQVSNYKWLEVFKRECTLRLEGVQVLSEGVCWTPQLQKGQVSMLHHLHLLLLLLPHCYCDLTAQRETNTQQDHTLILYSTTGSTEGFLRSSHLFLCTVECPLISISANVPTLPWQQVQIRAVQSWKGGLWYPHYSSHNACVAQCISGSFPFSGHSKLIVVVV